MGVQRVIQLLLEFESENVASLYNGRKRANKPRKHTELSVQSAEKETLDNSGR